MTNDNALTYLARLRQTIDEAPDGVDVSAIAAAVEAIANPGDRRTKIWFLLDRSGSMAHLTADVIGGYNQYVTDQAAKPGKARLTLVQFDGTNPFEVVHDARRIGNVPALNGDIYSPRGTTPLYDALGLMIRRADARLSERAAAGRSVEDQLVIVFTDGLENASQEFGRSEVFDLISTRMNDGWTFVFLGANQDSYAEGARLSVGAGNVQNFASTPDSFQMAFQSVSRATSEFRSKSRYQRVTDSEQFFGGTKEAEEALDQAPTKS